MIPFWNPLKKEAMVTYNIIILMHGSTHMVSNYHPKRIHKMKDEKMILRGDQTLNLAPIKYDYAYNTFQSMCKNTWFPSEIPMGSDVSTYKLDMSDVERHVYNHVFAQLSTMDMLAGDILKETVAKVVTSPEHQLAISMIIGQEAVHSDSYFYLADEMGLDQNWLWSRWSEVPQIKAKIDYSNEILNKFSENTDCNVVLKYFFLAGIFEGVWFLSDFAPIFALSGRLQLKGTNKMLRFIARDEDLHRAFGLRTIKNIIGESESFTKTKELIEIVETSVKLQFNYIDFLFSEGQILGITIEDYKEHIRWSINRSLKAIGFKDHYPDAKQMGWYTTLLTSKIEGNFFEDVIDEYQPLGNGIDDELKPSGNTEWDDPIGYCRENAGASQ
jgi:ribonucleoside-diphosphate reductase beta chain